MRTLYLTILEQQEKNNRLKSKPCKGFRCCSKCCSKFIHNNCSNGIQLVKRRIQYQLEPVAPSEIINKEPWSNKTVFWSNSLEPQGFHKSKGKPNIFQFCGKLATDYVNLK